MRYEFSYYYQRDGDIWDTYIVSVVAYIDFRHDMTLEFRIWIY